MKTYTKHIGGDMENSIYRVDKPYPEIVGATFSPETIAILRNLYASRVSELTAITTYTYQARVIGEHNPEVTALLEGVAMTEMRHLELLGEAIVEFGGDPAYANSRGQFWSGIFVDRDKNICKILKNNLRGETGAVAEYSMAATRVKNQSLANLLLRIAEDEQLHKELFETALTNLGECT